jgi:hypothetical protein
MHHSGLRYSGGIVKIAVGLDITSLSENVVLNSLINDPQRIAAPVASIQQPRSD